MKCPSCDHNYINKSDLDEHKLIEHGILPTEDTIRNELTCTICYKRFVFVTDLNNHIKTHDWRECLGKCNNSSCQGRSAENISGGANA